MKTGRWILTVLVLAICILQPALAPAVTIGQTDNFEDGTTQNWVVGLLGAVPPVPPANVATGGPAGDGDNYLLLTSVADLVTSPGNRLVVINETQWTGNYLSAGFNFITMDVNNLGTTDLVLRLRVEDPDAPPSNTPTHIAVSTQGIFVPAGSGWTRIGFPVGPSYFTALKGDVTAALSNVAEFRIYHNTTPTFPGPVIDALLGIDNIKARAGLLMTQVDFDHDGKTDATVWRPGDGKWYVVDSATGSASVRQWGGIGDVPVQGDYDGDGTTDVAVWRPSDGNWYIINSATGSANVRQWGGSGDVPVPGDYDGDGKTDVAVWRATNGNWYIVNSATGSVSVSQWGGSGDVPVPGDYDGDGKTDVAVWRATNGNWYIVNSATGSVSVSQWGGSGDVPVPGDYDGDGKTDTAVWRPSDGNWYIINSATGSANVRQWGGSGDVPVPGDYDGDGKTDIAVWRPSDGMWYVINSVTGSATVRQWGGSGDVPVRQ
jgi:hypothetical protein